MGVKEIGLGIFAETTQRVAEMERELLRYRERALDAEAELREILKTLSSLGPATETLLALAQRGTLKRIKTLLGDET